MEIDIWTLLKKQGKNRWIRVWAREIEREGRVGCRRTCKRWAQSKGIFGEGGSSYYLRTESSAKVGSLQRISFLVFHFIKWPEIGQQVHVPLLSHITITRKQSGRIRVLLTTRLSIDGKVVVWSLIDASNSIYYFASIPSTPEKRQWFIHPTPKCNWLDAFPHSLKGATDRLTQWPFSYDSSCPVAIVSH